MSHNTYFQFKKFRISQEKAAMKVGTDGVLLGAWTEITGNEKSILDIGTGTGLIALMLSQRSVAEITAIEIEKEAALEATENVKNSPWTNRVKVVHTSLQDLASDSECLFDLIVSNPPFFINNSKSADSKRNIARHTELLPIHELVSCSVKLLTKTGRLAVILPEEAANQLFEIGMQSGLFLKHVTEVKPDISKKTNRYLIELSRTVCEIERDSICIHLSCKSGYTPEYKNLTREYYLYF